MKSSKCPSYNKPYNPNIVISEWCVGFNLHKDPRKKAYFITCPEIFLLYLWNSHFLVSISIQLERAISIILTFANRWITSYPVFAITLNTENIWLSYCYFAEAERDEVIFHPDLMRNKTFKALCFALYVLKGQRDWLWSKSDN